MHALHTFRPCLHIGDDSYQYQIQTLLLPQK